MAVYKEIVTKAVVGKGKKVFTNTESVKPEIVPTAILGCWVINHNFQGVKSGDKVKIEGSYDVNIWYSCEDDTKTEVVRQHNTYSDMVQVRRRVESDTNNEEVIVRSLNQPTCTKVEIVDGAIQYTIEKELGIELVGDTKVKIAIDENEDPWDDIVDNEEDKVENEIDEQVNEDFLQDKA